MSNTLKLLLKYYSYCVSGPPFYQNNILTLYIYSSLTSGCILHQWSRYCFRWHVPLLPWIHKFWLFSFTPNVLSCCAKYSWVNQMWFNPLLKITSASFHAVRVASIYKKKQTAASCFGNYIKNKCSYICDIF